VAVIAFGKTSSRDAMLDIARGLRPDAFLVHKFGRNNDIDTDSEPESVWSGGGLYPWASFDTDQTLYCLSTDAGDTSTLTIEGLDDDFGLLTETVTLNGTSAVTTTNTFRRVFRMFYNGGSENAGTITARVTSGTGTVVAQVDAGLAQTTMAVYTIPAGYTGFLLAGDITVNAFRDIQLQFFVRPFGAPFRIAHMAETRGFYRYDFVAPSAIPEKSDLDVRITDVSLSNSRVTANFDLCLIKNEG